MATPPIFSPPGSIHLVTHVVIRQEFLLNPDGSVNQNILFLLGFMAMRYGIQIHSVAVLDNHLHLMITDVHGDQLGRFNNDFFSQLGRSMNVYRGRSGFFFQGGRPNCLLLAPTAETLIDKTAYLSTQATTAGLVSHQKKWPGVITHPKDQGNLKIQVDRPNFFYDPKGDSPESVGFELTAPICVDMDPETLQQKMVEEHNARERAKRDEYRRLGRKFKGAKQIRRQSVHSSPRKKHPLFNRRPHVACKDKDLRIRFLEWRKERLQRYRELLEFVRGGGKDAVFPVGTFAMHFRFGFDREPWSVLHPSGCIWRALMAEP